MKSIALFGRQIFTLYFISQKLCGHVITSVVYIREIVIGAIKTVGPTYFCCVVLYLNGFELLQLGHNNTECSILNNSFMQNALLWSVVFGYVGVTSDIYSLVFYAEVHCFHRRVQTFLPLKTGASYVQHSGLCICHQIFNADNI